MCGRVHYHNRQLAGLRHKGGGREQRVEGVRRYFGNGATAGKGWGEMRPRGKALAGEEGAGVVVWWVMEDVG